MGICVANPIPNGLVYGNKTCLQCIAGYTYNKMSSKCVRINTNYCQVGDTASANCITCIYGYFKYNNKCIKKINNCNTYDSAYLC